MGRNWRNFTVYINALAKPNKFNVRAANTATSNRTVQAICVP